MKTMKTTLRSLAMLLGGLLVVSCSRPNSTTAGQSAPSAAAVPLSGLPDVDADAVLAHTKVLSSDEFGGRGPGTKGEELTVQYLTDQFKKIGAKPGNSDGTYVQKVPLVGITPVPAPLIVKKGAAVQRLRWKDDVVAWTKHVADSASIDNSELVFVGYGVVAPEYNWDDYKGLDAKGKTLVMLVNDPPVTVSPGSSELDPKVFGGKAMTYYGRWTYKYEIGAEKGAAAVLIVHETGPAGYPFEVVQNKVTEQFDLVTPDKNLGRASIEGWVSLDQGKNLLKMAGQDFDALKKQAASRDFKPVPLGVTASMTIRNKLRTIDSQNVVAKIDGSDPALKDQFVVYTAHWDHLGTDSTLKGDQIFNGAKDNAVGTAGLLEIAHAFTKLPSPPKRSILFVSVTAEEQGLLGSQYYTVTPIYPLARTLANINMDGLNVNGRTKDLTLIGYGASDLDDYTRDAAAEQGRVIRPDPEPEKGFYYRSDHFNFAKEGVPALDPDEGIDFVGKPPDFGQKVRDDYNENRYHKPSDEVSPDWDLSGAKEDLKVFFAVGYRVAQATRFPDWKPGNEFKAKRDAQLKTATSTQH
jgi:Zn-dependent M28 family amino/carboxypeptidase